MGRRLAQEIRHSECAPPSSPSLSPPRFGAPIPRKCPFAPQRNTEKCPAHLAVFEGAEVLPKHMLRHNLLDLAHFLHLLGREDVDVLAILVLVDEEHVERLGCLLPLRNLRNQTPTPTLSTSVTTAQTSVQGKSSSFEQSNGHDGGLLLLLLLCVDAAGTIGGPLCAAVTTQWHTCPSRQPGSSPTAWAATAPPPTPTQTP